MRGNPPVGAGTQEPAGRATAVADGGAASFAPTGGPTQPVATEWLGIAGAAQHLGVSIHTVKAWRKRDRFAPAVRLGRLPRWRREDLDGWMETQREQPRLATIASRRSSTGRR